jgi:hypothetical protein
MNPGFHLVLGRWTPGFTSLAVARRAAVVVLAAAGLFLLYWRQSGSVPVSSDGAGNALQAWAMLHGNPLLHHWRVSDVSFYTTELPQYALIESVLGLGPRVIHVGAAMTYTLLVLLGGWVAKGRAQGRAGWTRALLAAGLMLAPQLSATQTLLLSPDHTGTSVPVLVTWLVIDRVTPDRWPAARWLTPAVVLVLLTWTMIGDSIILITCIVPLVLVCLVRTCRMLIRREPQWRELALAAAAAAGGGLGWAVPRVISALGGFRQAPVEPDTTLAALPHQAWVTFQAVLELFGANVFDARPAVEVGLVALHLIGALAVVCALGVALARFFRSADVLMPVFAVAIVLNVGAYLISAHALDIQGSREIAAVLPLGAALAGRVLAEPLLTMARGARAWLVPALGVIAAGYLAALGYGAAQPSALPAGQPLAAWLAAHRLTDGLAGYWQANSTTLASGGRVQVSAVGLARDGEVAPYEWETDDADYDPVRHDATFMLADGPAQLALARPAALRTFGAPQRVYRYDGYTVMVWDSNLLGRLGPP